MPNQLYQCHLVPLGSKAWKDTAMLLRLARPTENSMAMMGRPMMTRKNRYTSTKAAPPYWPTM